MKWNQSLFGTFVLVVFAAVVPTDRCAAQSVTPFFRGVKLEVMIGRPSKIEGGDFDDKTQKLEPRVKLTNIDTRSAYENFKGALMLFGQSTVDPKVVKVLSRHEFNISLPIRKIHDEKAPEVSTRYDTTGAKFGFKYDGWILVVSDPSGKLAVVKSSSPSFEKMPTQIATLRQDACYTRQLKPVEEPRLKL